MKRKTTTKRQWIRRKSRSESGAVRVALFLLILASTTAAYSTPPPVLNSMIPAALDDTSALGQVGNLAGRLTRLEQQQEYFSNPNRPNNNDNDIDDQHVQGLGGALIQNNQKSVLDAMAQEQAERLWNNQPAAGQEKEAEKKIWEALATLEKDMQVLDRIAGQKASLSWIETSVLILAVSASAISPLTTTVLAPAAAASTAAVAIFAEYIGKVAVADSKEIAAASMQCAAEAEGLLAQAERSKAIVPLCVGSSATAASLALLVPVLLENYATVPAGLYLMCPLVSILSAAVASLAYEETAGLTAQAIGIGARRFARSGMVGRAWLSSAEMILRKSDISVEKWRNFAVAVVPSPLIAALVPGVLGTKAIVAAALAAAQSAYYLTQAESALGRASDAVALKARSAAVCDTYANQGARSAAILPFTSALGGLCAAATAAIVELPFVESLAATGTVWSLLGEIATVATFPFFSALLAAAATVSKARCQVDSDAAMQAASTLALQYRDEREDPVLRPMKGVVELIRLSFQTTLRRLNPRVYFRLAKRWVGRRRTQRRRRNRLNI